MAKLKIAVLYDQWDEDDAEAAGHASRSKRRRRKREEPTEDIQEVYEALKTSGHNPCYVLLDGTNESLVALGGVESDLCFNLTESYRGDDTKDTNIAAYLELLGMRYTGAGPEALYLAQDKPTAKKIFAFHEIRTPVFATVFRGRLEHAHDIRFPLIVKPAREDGSIGIEFSAVVRSIKELMERIDALHVEFDSPVLLEEYVEGREIYVGILGNDKAETLPIVELDLSRLPEGTPRIAGTEVKWEKNTDVYRITKPFFPQDIDEKTTEKIQATALAAYQALRLRDYGRIDIRLDKRGRPHVLEVNPNPYLLGKAEFCMAAKKSGRGYAELINEIVELALSRYRGPALTT
jgi:D-alanine-D-alanine ligase